MSNSFNQIKYDISNNFGEDMVLSSTDDLLNVSDLELSKQRVLKRLLTNPGDYIWHTDYGAGLGRYVGDALSPDLFDEIKSLILSQIFLEDSVANNPEPQISMQTIQGGLFVQINYVDNPSKQPIVLSFSVN